MNNKPEYQSIAEVIATMKEVVHREYFGGMKEQIVIDSIERWMNEAVWTVINQLEDLLPAYYDSPGLAERKYEDGWDDCLSKVKEHIEAISPKQDNQPQA